MSEVVRLYRYKCLVSARRTVSVEDLMASLEISCATFKRDMSKLRDQFHVPIEFNRELDGYLKSLYFHLAISDPEVILVETAAIRTPKVA